MRFIASQHGMTNTLSTTQRFVVMSDDDFSAILHAVNLLGLFAMQVEQINDLDDEPMDMGRVVDLANEGSRALGRARWMQIVVS